MTKHALWPATALVISVSLCLSGVTNHIPAGSVMHAEQLAGTELINLDRDNAHYTQAADGWTDVQLYNAPVGTVDETGWHARDTSLVAGNAQGTYHPADQPIKEQLDTTTPASLASLTSEDGVTFSIGLSTVGGTAPAGGMGQVSGSSITLPGAAGATQMVTGTVTPDATQQVTSTTTQASSPAVSVHATISGVDIHLDLSDPSQAEPIVFTANPDARLKAVQDGDGSIRFYRTIARAGDDGVSTYSLYQTEYRVLPPVVTDSSSDPAAVVRSGTATLSLDTTNASQPSIGVAIEPAWLDDPSRVYPVHIDLPVATSYAMSHSEQFGTVSSCAPDQPAPRTDVVVGTEGSCTYNGQLHFDTSSLVYGSPTIASATLWLYSPTQAGETGVQVFQNAPPTLQSWQTPTWNTATQVLTGTTGLVEGAGNGNWHSWDVTSLVQEWVQNPSSSGGLTLESAGPLVQLSSPVAANSTDPSLAPYLDIHYTSAVTAASMNAASAQVSPNTTCTNRGYCDGSNFIWGVSGGFAVDSTVDSSSPCQPSERICSQGAAVRIPLVQAVANGQQSFTGQPGPGAVYIRLGVQLECLSSPQTPVPWGWWNTSVANTLTLWGTIQSAPTASIGTILKLVVNAANDGIIPVVDLLPNQAVDKGHNPVCTSDPTTDKSWYNQAASLADAISSVYPSNRMIYYEIGNEMNVANSQAYMPDYPTVYAAAAAAIYHIYSLKVASPKVRVLTGGVLDPTSDTNASDCYSSPDPISKAPAAPYNYYTTIEAAITKAENGGFRIPASYLGLAVHPYGYTTNDSRFWANYRDADYRQTYLDTGQQYQNIYDGPCRDLSNMINLWLGATSTPGTSVFANLPLIFTEDNWQSAFDNGVSVALANQRQSTGAYLVDLETWMHDLGWTITDISPIRVLWFSAIDPPGKGCNPQDSKPTDPNPGVCWGIFGFDSERLQRGCNRETISSSFLKIILVP